MIVYHDLFQITDTILLSLAMFFLATAITSGFVGYRVCAILTLTLSKWFDSNWTNVRFKKEDKLVIFE